MVNYEWVQQNSREFNSSENVHFFWVPISSLYLFQFSFYHFNLLKTLKFSQQKERLVSCCIANFISIGVFDMEYLISISKYTCNCTAFLKYKYFTMMLGWDRSWSGAILVWGNLFAGGVNPITPSITLWWWDNDTKMSNYICSLCRFPYWYLTICILY